MATYRLKLERESDGKVIHQWGRITEARVRPVLRAIDAVLPLLVRAAQAKRAIAWLLEAKR